MTPHAGPGGPCPGLLGLPPNLDVPPLVWLLQVIVYVEDVNDEAPAFTQQQYSRLGLRETAGIGTSVIVVRATDRDTGEASWGIKGVRLLGLALCSSSLVPLWSPSSLGWLRLPRPAAPRLGRDYRYSPNSIPTGRLSLEGLKSGSCPSLWMETG